MRSLSRITSLGIMGFGRSTDPSILRGVAAVEFTCDHEAEAYRCPGGAALKPHGRNKSKDLPEFGKDGSRRYFARDNDCAACPGTPTCTPTCTPNRATRRISRSRQEGARETAHVRSSTGASARNARDTIIGDRLAAAARSFVFALSASFQQRSCLTGRDPAARRSGTKAETRRGRGPVGRKPGRAGCFRA